MGAVAISELVPIVSATSPPATGVLAVVDGLFYHISRPVFLFLLVKIVFLIVKLEI